MLLTKKDRKYLAFYYEFIHPEINTMKKLLGLIPYSLLLIPFLSKAQIAINNTAANPDASAILDLKTGNTGVNKGFLPQSVALTNVTVATPVTSPATGLIVYSSTAPAGGNGTGYYYWNGTAWASLNSVFGGSGTNNYVARWTPNATSLGTGLIQDNNTSVSIDTTPVTGAMLFVNSNSVGHSGIITRGDTALSAHGTKYGITAYSTNIGISANSNNIGILSHGAGYGISASGGNYGGEFTSPNGVGVYGAGGSKGGYFIGTKGQGVYSSSTTAAGDSSIGATYGVFGSSNNYGGWFTSSQGYGVVGISYEHSLGVGVSGYCDSSYGYGVVGEGNYVGVDGVGQYGVYGDGVYYGVYGLGYIGGDFNGQQQGVVGISSHAAGDSSIGITYGVYGLSSIKKGFGIYGTNNATGGVGVKAIGDTALTAYGTRDGIKAYGSTENGVEGFGANAGVYGSGANFGGRFLSAAGQGVYSSSSYAAGDSSIGVTYGGFFKGTSGPGVYSKSSTVAGDSSIGKTYGGYFSATAGIGVDGGGTSYGGYFTATKGQGVYSASSGAAGDSTTGKTYGLYSATSDPSGTHAGVYAVDNNVNNGWGLIASGFGGVSASGHLYGVSASGGNFGVYGTAPDAGVYGVGENFGGGVGVQGFGYNATIASWPLNSGNVFSGTSYGLYAAQTTAATTGVAAIYAQDAQTSDNVQVNAWSGSTHYKVLGSFAGSVSCAVKDLNGDKVVMHCPETPEFYFEDYGEGQLMNGKAHIDLDPILAKNVAIDEKHHLRVFIQLDGDCKGVYVANKTTTGFDVVELNGGASNTSFEWHIICNAKDENEGGVVNHNQDLRFEKAPLVKMFQTKTESGLKVPPTIIQPSIQGKN